MPPQVLLSGLCHPTTLESAGDPDERLPSIAGSISTILEYDMQGDAVPFLVLDMGMSRVAIQLESRGDPYKEVRHPRGSFAARTRFWLLL